MRPDLILSNNFDFCNHHCPSSRKNEERFVRVQGSNPRYPLKAYLKRTNLWLMPEGQAHTDHPLFNLGVVREPASNGPSSPAVERNGYSSSTLSPPA